MNDQEKIRFVIKALGHAGACACLRVNRDKMAKLLMGQELTLSLKKYLARTLQAIIDIEEGYKSLSYVEAYYYWHRGADFEELRKKNKHINTTFLAYFPQQIKTTGI